MKNIHVIPTDKLSRIISSNKEFTLLKNYTTDKRCKNIYITSNEEIKKGDWCFEMYNGESKATTSNFVDEKGNRWWLRQMNMYCSVNDPECKKIILTTDQDLIKDGVQDIPDEFLEWFVKNPSCEEVEVKSEILYEHKDTYRPYPSDCKNLSKTKVNYYLSIIPKEEWKCCGAFYGCDKCEHKKEETKQDKIMERFIANTKKEEDERRY